MKKINQRSSVCSTLLLLNTRSVGSHIYSTNTSQGMNFSRAWEAQPSIGTSVALDWLECQWEVNIGPELSLQVLMLQVKSTRGAGSTHSFLLYLISIPPPHCTSTFLSFATPSIENSHISDVERPLKRPWHSGVGEDKGERRWVSWHSLCQHLVKHGGCQRLSVSSGVGGWKCLMWQDMTCTLLQCSCRARLHASLMTSPLLATFTFRRCMYFWSSLQNCVITPNYKAACATEQATDSIQCDWMYNIPFYNESN